MPEFVAQPTNTSSDVVKIIIAKDGEFLETLQRRAHEAIAVFPYGADWEPITESSDAFEALLTQPIKLLPNQSQKLI